MPDRYCLAKTVLNTDGITTNDQTKTYGKMLKINDEQTKDNRRAGNDVRKMSGLKKMINSNGPYVCSRYSKLRDSLRLV